MDQNTKKKKVGRQLGQVIPEKITHFRVHRFMLQKQKRVLFFIPIKVQSITISSATPYISEINITSNSIKKRKISQEGERGKEREKKRVRTGRGRRRKRRRKRGKRGKRGRESSNGKEKEKEKEKKEEKEKEEKEEGEKIEKAVLKVLL